MFLINVPVIAVGVVLMAFLVPESRNPEPGRLDPLGVALSVVGLVVLSYGIIQGGEKGNWLELPVLGPILAGLAVLALFAWHEARTASPAFDVKLFKDPRMSAAVASIALCFFAATGVFFFANFYMQSVRGLTPLQSGAMVLPFAVAQLAFAPRSAAMVRRFGAKAVCTTGLMLVTVALASYQFVGTHTSLWILGAIFFVQGAGMANVMPPATESVMSALPREKAGAGSAVNNVARQVAVAMGVAVLGSVVASVYRGDLRDRLAALPAGAREAAGRVDRGRARRRRPARPGRAEPRRPRRRRLRARHAHRVRRRRRRLLPRRPGRPEVDAGTRRGARRARAGAGAGVAAGEGRACESVMRDEP